MSTTAPQSPITNVTFSADVFHRLPVAPGTAIYVAVSEPLGIELSFALVRSEADAFQN